MKLSAGATAVMLFGLASSACDSTRPSDGTRPDDNPLESPNTCPAEHLVIGLYNPSGGSAIARRSAVDLTACRGTNIDGDLTAVGGLIDGSELIGVDNQVKRIALSGAEIWAHDAPSYGLEAAGFATLALGEYAVAVLWMGATSSSGQEIEILHAETGESMARYTDLRGSPVAITAGLDGVGDRVALLDQYEALREAQVVIGLPSLGGATEREVAMPRTGGSLTWAASVGPSSELGFPGRVAVGSGRGVVYWSTDLPPAALGPVGCTWPAYSGQVLPVACEDYDATVPIPGASARFVASCIERSAGSSRPAIVELGGRGDCRVLSAPTAFAANVRITGMAWAGR